MGQHCSTAPKLSWTMYRDASDAPGQSIPTSRTGKWRMWHTARYRMEGGRRQEQTTRVRRYRGSRLHGASICEVP